MVRCQLSSYACAAVLLHHTHTHCRQHLVTQFAAHLFVGPAPIVVPRLAAVHAPSPPLFTATTCWFPPTYGLRYLRLAPLLLVVGFGNYQTPAPLLLFIVLPPACAGSLPATAAVQCVAFYRFCSSACCTGLPRLDENLPATTLPYCSVRCSGLWTPLPTYPFPFIPVTCGTATTTVHHGNGGHSRATVSVTAPARCARTGLTLYCHPRRIFCLPADCYVPLRLPLVSMPFLTFTTCRCYHCSQTAILRYTCSPRFQLLPQNTLNLYSCSFVFTRSASSAALIWTFRWDYCACYVEHMPCLLPFPAVYITRSVSPRLLLRSARGPRFAVRLPRLRPPGFHRCYYPSSPPPARLLPRFTNAILPPTRCTFPPCVRCLPFDSYAHYY